MFSLDSIGLCTMLDTACTFILWLEHCPYIKNMSFDRNSVHAILIYRNISYLIFWNFWLCKSKWFFYEDLTVNFWLCLTVHININMGFFFLIFHNLTQKTIWSYWCKRITKFQVVLTNLHPSWSRIYNQNFNKTQTADKQPGSIQLSKGEAQKINVLMTKRELFTDK